MTTTDSITALNELVEINNDRIEGYKTAIKETSDSNLRSTFLELTSTSEKNLSELIEAVYNLGGKPEEGTRTSGKIYRVWMDAKAALTGNNRHQILSSCEYGEDVALEAYEHVLENHADELSASHLELVRSQKSRMQADHDKVKAMRDAE
jgi:uncharacterized protein (TIGR02284 family)